MNPFNPNNPNPNNPNPNNPNPNQPIFFSSPAYTPTMDPSWGTSCRPTMLERKILGLCDWISTRFRRMNARFIGG
ncbi:hypothetical protein HanRHA438_Chr10g0472211 [Helianthus annuus]|nr:hypothetical protein HanRHA438_Chr10g0472211 [Helianthus annuus]